MGLMVSRLTLRRFTDIFASRVMLAATVFSALLVVLIAVGLFLRSRPVLASQSLNELLFSSVWHPSSGEFGLFNFIIGTLWVTGAAMVLAVPLCILTSIYLAEYAPGRVRAVVKPMIDLLAGIPSVVFGLMGILLIVPLSSDIASMLGVTSNGYNVLSGGIVLAIMVFPAIISVSEEVIRTVPQGMREASLALGATRWQATKLVVTRGALTGIIAAVVLGFTRAFGETMAVLMVVGSVARAPSTVFDPSYPLTALIANNYGEMLSVPMYDSALLFAALVLLGIVFLFSLGARVILVRMERRYGHG